MHKQGLESSLRRALENEELVLYFQPVVALESGRVAGAELLLRWKDQQDGLLQPDRAIALTEDVSLVNEIGLWIVREACSKVMAWQKQGITSINVAVNISGCEIEQAEFVKDLSNVIEDSGCASEHLELMIGEDYLINISDQAAKNLEQLASKGLQIIIDDFGVAYSSLTYLKQFPISKLKIDQSFVRDLLVDSNDQAIARAIIALAQSLGLRTLAEGIENEKQQAFVFSQGCDQGTGPLYSKPMPEQQFLEYLKDRQDESGI
jgi:EAL domain-containing protein (putative c-di-GMP-specific phosphodiesterase class I)